jgi:hypothetical protein
MRVAKNLESGMESSTAFQKASFLRMDEAGLLDLSVNREGCGWTFRQLGEQRLERCMRWYSCVVQIMVVLMTFATAVVVGALAIGLFSFLTDMIDSQAHP